MFQIISTFNEFENTMRFEKGLMGKRRNLDDGKWLVWNVESLYKDLPFLVSQVKKENDKQQNMYGDLLRDSLKENER